MLTVSRCSTRVLCSLAGYGAGSDVLPYQYKQVLHWLEDRAVNWCNTESRKWRVCLRRDRWARVLCLQQKRKTNTVFCPKMSACREGPVPAPRGRRWCWNKEVDIWAGAASNTVPSSFFRYLSYPCSCFDRDLLYKSKRYWTEREKWINTEHLTTSSSLSQACRISWRRRETVPCPRTFPPETGKDRPPLRAQPTLIHPRFNLVVMSSNFEGGDCVSPGFFFVNPGYNDSFFNWRNISLLW